MKKILLFALLAILGVDSMYSQSKTKTGAKKTVRTTNAQKGTRSKSAATPKTKDISSEEMLKKSIMFNIESINAAEEREYYEKNVEGKPYFGTVLFSDFYPAYTLAYDVHTLRTSQVVIFNFSQKFVQYAIMSAIDRDLIRNGDDRGSLILQNSLAKEHTRNSARYSFQQEGNIFTFVEEFTKDGKNERINHKFRYDKQTNSFYDMDHNMTLTEYKE